MGADHRDRIAVLFMELINALVVSLKKDIAVREEEGLVDNTLEQT